MSVGPLLAAQEKKRTTQPCRVAVNSFMSNGFLVLSDARNAKTKSTTVFYIAFLFAFDMQTARIKRFIGRNYLNVV